MDPSLCLGEGGVGREGRGLWGQHLTILLVILRSVLVAFRKEGAQELL